MRTLVKYLEDRRQILLLISEFKRIDQLRFPENLSENPIVSREIVRKPNSFLVIFGGIEVN